MSEKSSISAPSGDDAAPSRAHVFGRAVHQATLLRGRRMVSAPYEQAGQIKAVVCVQVRQQDVHRVGVGVALQGTQHAATEIED